MGAGSSGLLCQVSGVRDQLVIDRPEYSLSLEYPLPMGNCWTRLWCCWRPRPPEDDPFATEPLDDPNHGIISLDRSFRDLVSTDGTGTIVFSTRMSEGAPVYSVDLKPPFALRSINGNAIAYMERLRTLETPHKLVLHGKGDEYSAVNAWDFSRYYRVAICSPTMVTKHSKNKGLNYVGVLSTGLRNRHSPAATLLNPPGEYSTETGFAEELHMLAR